MARLTPSQESAVKARDAEILVSAGAGSGKTTVLSERVLSLLEEGVDVDRLVVLTFTNAAAAEMKARIRNNIRNAGLIDQIKRLDNAVISTFDSFAQRIVREYRHLLPHATEPGIADSVLVAIERNRLVQTILEEAYEEGDPEFLAQALLLFDKTDHVLAQGILTLAANLQRLPDRMEALDRLEAANRSDERIASIVLEYVAMLSKDAMRVQTEAGDLFAIANLVSKAEAYGAAIAERIGAIGSASTFEEHCEAAMSSLPKAPSFGKDDPDKAAFSEANKRFKSAWDHYRKRLDSVACKTDAELRSSLSETAVRAQWIYRLTRRFLLRWDHLKRTKKLHQFHDVFDDALWLLRNGEGVATHYRKAIEEILIDEYQDNNDLQEAFLDALGCKRRFYVGDVKQSIYGFRDANPAHFMAKATLFEQTGHGRLIPLTHNFRSRPEVLQDINRLFERLMDVPVGGADYSKGHALEFGNMAYRDEPVREAFRGLAFLAYDKPEKESSVPVEAALIASDIRRQIDGGRTVHDWKNGGLKSLSYGDVAIIVDRKSAFPVYRDALTAYGIPVKVLADETFVAAGEIQTAANLLRLIRIYASDSFPEDEFRRAFYGACRSYALRIEDRHVLEFFSMHRCSTHADLDALSTHPVFAPVDRIVRELAVYSKTHSVAETYEETAHRFDLLGKAAMLEDPLDAEAKLLYLQTKLASFEAFDLDMAISYFEAIDATSDLDIDYVKVMDEDRNAVTMLTMHKSKGLEFPICYFPGLDRTFHLPEAKEFFQFHPAYGLFSKAMRHGFHDTPLHALLQEKRRALDRSERMRLLYVALTRVKEAGYLLFDRSLLDKTEPNAMMRPVFERRSANRFSDWTTAFAQTFLPILEGSIDDPPKRELADGFDDQATPFVFRERSIPAAITSKRVYSAKRPLGNASRGNMQFGETLHETLRSIDWHRIDDRNLTDPERIIVERIARLPILGLPLAKHYREVPFLDDEDNLAIVDLIVETDDELRVVDFKAKSLDHPEYFEQVGGYVSLLRSRTTKRVRGYLVSLLTGQVLPVED